MAASAAWLLVFSNISLSLSRTTMTLVIAARQVRSSLVAALAVLCLNRLSPIGAEGAQLVPAQSAARRRVTQWFYRSSGPSARRSRGCRHQDDGDLNARSAHARHPCKRWEHGGGDPTGCIVLPPLTAPDANQRICMPHMQVVVRRARGGLQRLYLRLRRRRGGSALTPRLLCFWA